MNPFAQIPDDLSALTPEELSALGSNIEETLQKVAASPADYVSDEFTNDDLYAAAEDAVDALTAVREELSAREGEDEDPAPAEGENADPEPESEPTPEAGERDDEFASRLSELARSAQELPEPSDPAPAPAPDPDPAPAPAPERTLAAASRPRASRARLPRPSASHRPAPVEDERIQLVASSAGTGFDVGEPLDRLEVAAAMIEKRRHFGPIPEGVSGETFGIARANWSDRYDEDFRLGMDEEANLAKVREATRDVNIRQAFESRRRANPGALVAAGGLCAPVTPYYQLAMVSVADRPVQAALPSFNADRGGMRYAAPATLSTITTGVGTMTAANDALGGTFATKTCQTVTCPPFQETDVQVIFHCLQFGNLGARTFPERVAQWNSLTLAAHSRLAESALLTAIDAASTAVTAVDSSTNPLGASAHLLSQVLAASNAMRSRHRMRPDTVLRAIFPFWVLDLLVSDVYRSQFDRFDMTPDKFVALLREANIEPTFHIDGATGASQVFGTQSAAALLGFPSTVRWYLFPEGSFIYLDGGVLELGIVRDSVLNKTNDFQIFGETFENVVFVGVESLAITSTLCDNGAVSLPVLYTECGDYGTS